MTDSVWQTPIHTEVGDAVFGVIVVVVARKTGGNWTTTGRGPNLVLIRWEMGEGKGRL
jgi:hypothetical protein